MKKIFLIVAVLAITIAVIWSVKGSKVVPFDPTIAQYRNPTLGISFTYPKILTTSTTDGVVILHHEIPFENTGDCDMMGGEETYTHLTDFNLTIQTINKNIVDTMKSVSPYIPQENFVNNEVVVSPGFIDVFKVGKFDGFAIYEGAEGCGQTTYYLPIESNKTVLIGKASIQALSGVVNKTVRDQVLAVPGVISMENSDEIFLSVINTLKVQ